MSKSEHSGLRSVAARRRDWRERQQRSRENGGSSAYLAKTRSTPHCDSFSWAIRRQLRQRTRVRDLVHGGLQVDVETVVARAIVALSGYTGPKSGDPKLAAAAKVIGARVVQRIVADRVWWTGSGACPGAMTSPMRTMASPWGRMAIPWTKTTISSLMMASDDVMTGKRTRPMSRQWTAHRTTWNSAIPRSGPPSWPSVTRPKNRRGVSSRYSAETCHAPPATVSDRPPAAGRWTARSPEAAEPAAAWAPRGATTSVRPAPSRSRPRRTRRARARAASRRSPG